MGGLIVHTPSAIRRETDEQVERLDGNRILTQSGLTLTTFLPIRDELVEEDCSDAINGALCRRAALSAGVGVSKRVCAYVCVCVYVDMCFISSQPIAVGYTA